MMKQTMNNSRTISIYLGILLGILLAAVIIYYYQTPFAEMKMKPLGIQLTCPPKDVVLAHLKDNTVWDYQGSQWMIDEKPFSPTSDAPISMLEFVGVIDHHGDDTLNCLYVSADANGVKVSQIAAVTTLHYAVRLTTSPPNWTSSQNNSMSVCKVGLNQCSFGLSTVFTTEDKQ